MHILTKIFIVLVTLLAIFMVPLVVVSATNQEHWKSEAMSFSQSHRLISSQLQAERQNHQAVVAGHEQELQDYSQRLSQLQAGVSECDKLRLDLESQLMTANLSLTEHGATTRTMVKSLQTNSELNKVLVVDLQKLRSRAISAERQKLELDDALRERDSQLQVALAARRKLQEELKVLRDQQASAMGKISEYVARFGSLGDESMSLDKGVAPDRNLESTVLDVSRGDDRVLVEIDAGSRDGVKEGWVLTIGDEGTFIGKLRIIDVDINRSTGILSLENSERGSVRIGHRAYALMGQD
ncbi:MAG: hypothetical protein CMJ24_04680 [Phycisphaerae bacterium]|nr:hypothetical protein [Phycisphaerae bacterium]MDG1899048.1 hypothetical protein [Phycisphaerales bacterium]